MDHGFSDLTFTKKQYWSELFVDFIWPEKNIITKQIVDKYVLSHCYVQTSKKPVLLPGICYLLQLELLVRSNLVNVLKLFIIKKRWENNVKYLKDVK